MHYGRTTCENRPMNNFNSHTRFFTCPADGAYFNNEKFRYPRFPSIYQACERHKPPKSFQVASRAFDSILRPTNTSSSSSTNATSHSARYTLHINSHQSFFNHPLYQLQKPLHSKANAHPSCLKNLLKKLPTMPAVNATLMDMNTTLSAVTNGCQLPTQHGLGERDIAAIVLRCILDLQVRYALVALLVGCCGTCCVRFAICCGHDDF